MTRQTLLWVWVLSFCFSQASNSQSTLTQEDIDQTILYGAPQDPSDLEEDKTYMDQIIVNQDWAATTGCLDVRADGRTWNGTEGGQCANSGTDKGTFTFGYGQTVLAQTQDAINDALKIAGISVVGYRWQWRVKNADTNYETTNGARGQDPLYIRVIVKDSEGNVLDEREWDYSYHIDGWEQKYGMHWYDPFISGEDIDTITTEIEAYDAGYWAGWYGPEVGEVGIYSIFVYEAPEEDCTDPLLDPTCPGYADALNAQQEEQLALIAQSTETEFFGDDDVEFVAEVTVTVEESVDPISEGSNINEISTEENTTVETQVIEEPSQGETAESTETATEADPASSAEPERKGVDPLSVAQNAVSEALSQADLNAQNTLDSTQQSVTEAESIFNENEQQVQQLSQSQIAETDNIAAEIQELSTEAQVESQTQTTIATQIENSSMSQSTGQTESNTQSNSVEQSMNTGSSLSGVDNSGNYVVSINTGNQQEINTMNATDLTSNDIGNNEIVIEVTIDSFEIAALDMAIDTVFQSALNNSLLAPEQIEEQEQENTEEQNAQEDELVEKALSGDDSEDAQAALLGYNPEFRAYQTPQIPDGNLYQPKDIYDEQQNYDNPNQRFFNGASDELHREMVRKQYE
jgi:hypothetical protein